VIDFNNDILILKSIIPFDT